MKKYLLRNMSFGIVKLPTEIWQEMGWNISDEVGIKTTEISGKPVIVIEKLRDVSEWRKEEGEEE
jgi:bifunctional DNA-binding transcriptional regulator/antitoxin component of YhaV-PrlF toxin-antitoxin module